MTLGRDGRCAKCVFPVNYGERVALVAPTGAGKTTLFSKNHPEGAASRNAGTIDPRS